jgi:hypothetical protein
MMTAIHRCLLACTDVFPGTHSVLVTTSWFASGCRKKALEHGRMELIDGPELIHLIKQYLGKDVLISIPNRPNPPSNRGHSRRP